MLQARAAGRRDGAAHVDSILPVVELFEMGVFPQVGDDVSPGMGNDEAELFVALLEVVEDRPGEGVESVTRGGGYLERQ